MAQELVSNRKAFFHYEILETWEAGIALYGSEIKSLRNHGGSLQDAYVDAKGHELWLLHATIAPYTFTRTFSHEERRPRKLLLHKKEIEKIRRAVVEKGVVAIPLSIYLNAKGIAKVKIALAKGKKAYDKRAALKEKEQKRAIRREDE
jgi:SsrA-binding protein